MNARTIRMISAAAVLGAAGYAHAQTAPREGGWREPPSRPGATQPAPAPAPPTKQPGATAQQQPADEAQRAQLAAELNDRTRRIFGELALENAHAVEVAQLGTQKGSSEEVKRLAQRLSSEHVEFQEDLRKVIAERGGDFEAMPRPEGKAAQHQQLLQRLQGLSGAEFDREFVLAVRAAEGAHVDALKRMRDETPGKTASIKWWLDAHENRAEERLTATRQVKQALDAQRAAKR